MKNNLLDDIMLQILSLMLFVLSIIISIFVIYKSYKKEKEIHNQIIKDVTENPHLAKMVIKDFPVLKEKIMSLM